LPSARNRHRFEPFEWRQQTPEMSIRSMSCHRQICSTRRSNSGDKATGTFAAAKRSPRDYTEVYISLECTTTSLAHGTRICSPYPVHPVRCPAHLSRRLPCLSARWTHGMQSIAGPKRGCLGEMRRQRQSRDRAGCIMTRMAALKPNGLTQHAIDAVNQYSIQ
jgi:hypothetical protein